ncbi:MULTISPECIES: DNA/RNA non-specific endonuclease [Bacillaceae]|uniref:DNA/RNA non-specific endonuclease n=1 Tax=Bacillaceae TaxID=186817 RepID=UPI00210E505C|nr:DNA/RNA non-specific endonuclease [Bacillus sp. sid0103]
MDVKYIPSDWEKMKDGIGDLIGLGHWGKGMIDTLKDLSDNLEDAESDIANYDSDGVITFHHTSQKSKYQGLFEDYEILHNFTGKVGEIVDRTIDQPFYEDMDAFVKAMRDLTISNYTTTNRVGATETQYVYAGYGPAQSFEVPKTEVSLDDLFSGDNYYANQMKLEYDAWKVLNPDQDFSQEEYQQAVLNTRAFEYESIRNQQENKEFWVQIGALVVIVGATIICPPAGMALGVAYGAMELSSAVSGKDWVSGRELGTSERWFRGLLAPLDIVPGVSGLTKFSSTVRLAHLEESIGTIGLRTGVKGSIHQGITHIDHMVKTAGQQSVTRLRNASAAIKDAADVVINKLAKDTIEVGRLADTVITGINNTVPFPKRLVVTSTGEKVYLPVEKSPAVENSLKNIISKIDGINFEVAASKGKSNGKNIINDTIVKEVREIDFGEHIIKGKNGKKELLPNIKYITNDNYKYTTDDLGRIIDVDAPELVLKKADRNKYAQANVGGEDRLPDDDGGHLIGAQFNGPADIDNLVPQNSQINRRGGVWYEMETEWANALKEIPPKKVSVQIEPIYTKTSMRPDSFMVEYEIDGDYPVIREIANKSGG